MLPAINVGAITVVGVKVRGHNRAIPTSHVIRRHSLQLTSPDWTAIQMALCPHLREAVVAVSAIMREIVQFDTYRMQVSRASESAFGSHLLRLLNSLPSQNGTRVARSVLTLADVGCESLGERALLWILLSVFPMTGSGRP